MARHYEVIHFFLNHDAYVKRESAAAGKMRTGGASARSSASVAVIATDDHTRQRNWCHPANSPALLRSWMNFLCSLAT